MLDTESQTSQVESFHSPLHSDSHLPRPDKSPPFKAIVAVALDNYHSPLRSPPRNYQPDDLNFLPPSPPPAVSPSPKWSVREDKPSGVTKVGPAGGGGGGGEGPAEESVGGERRPRPAVASILRRSRKDVTAARAALGLRICQVILCLISFSVMAADKTRGWSRDSFYRYKEYRYCLAATVIAFLYSGFQVSDLAYHLITEKHVISHHLRCHFDFLMDQILAYLLLSASSSAATRVDDWVPNWGKYQFTEMASASVGMSILALAAFALSSLISGYKLYNNISGGL